MDLILGCTILGTVLLTGMNALLTEVEINPPLVAKSLMAATVVGIVVAALVVVRRRRLVLEVQSGESQPGLDVVPRASCTVAVIVQRRRGAHDHVATPGSPISHPMSRRDPGVQRRDPDETPVVAARQEIGGPDARLGPGVRHMTLVGGQQMTFPRACPATTSIAGEYVRLRGRTRRTRAFSRPGGLPPAGASPPAGECTPAEFVCLRRIRPSASTYSPDADVFAGARRAGLRASRRSAGGWRVTQGDSGLGRVR